MKPLILAYPNARIINDNIAIYAIALSELSEAKLTSAVLKCMRTCKFFPSIAEIMEQADNMVQVATGTKHKTNDEAWNEVLKQMNEAFVYKKPVFSTPEIEQAALAMGWTSMCETETDNMGTIRAQFLRMYESVCKRKREQKIDNDVLNLIGKAGIKAIGGKP